MLHKRVFMRTFNLLACLVVVGCGRQSGAECTEDSDCADGMVCEAREPDVASRPTSECLIPCGSDGDCPIGGCTFNGQWRTCEVDGFCTTDLECE